MISTSCAGFLPSIGMINHNIMYRIEMINPSINLCKISSIIVPSEAEAPAEVATWLRLVMVWVHGMDGLLAQCKDLWDVWKCPQHLKESRSIWSEKKGCRLLQVSAKQISGLSRLVTDLLRLNNEMVLCLADHCVMFPRLASGYSMIDSFRMGGTGNSSPSSWFGGFQTLGYPRMDCSEWTILWKLMIWG